MFGLEGYILGVQGKIEHVAWEFACQGEVEFSAVRTAQIELAKLIADDLRAALRGMVPRELLVEKLNPAAVDFFGFRRGMRDAGVDFHHDLTIQHEGGCGTGIGAQSNCRKTVNREEPLI